MLGEQKGPRAGLAEGWGRRRLLALEELPGAGQPEGASGGRGAGGRPAGSARRRVGPAPLAGDGTVAPAGRGGAGVVRTLSPDTGVFCRLRYRLSRALTEKSNSYVFQKCSGRFQARIHRHGQSRSLVSFFLKKRKPPKTGPTGPTVARSWRWPLAQLGSDRRVQASPS